VAPERFAELLASMMPAIERVAASHGARAITKRCSRSRLHTFEKERVDVAVIEVGLGGALDGTNVLKHPDVCVITTVGFRPTPTCWATRSRRSPPRKPESQSPAFRSSPASKCPVRSTSSRAARARLARRSCAWTTSRAVLDRPRRVPETGQTFAVETALATTTADAGAGRVSTPQRGYGDAALERAARRLAPRRRRRRGGVRAAGYPRPDGSRVRESGDRLRHRA